MILDLGAKNWYRKYMGQKTDTENSSSNNLTHMQRNDKYTEFSDMLHLQRLRTLLQLEWTNQTWRRPVKSPEVLRQHKWQEMF